MGVVLNRAQIKHLLQHWSSAGWSKASLAWLMNTLFVATFDSGTTRLEKADARIPADAESDSTPRREPGVRYRTISEACAGPLPPIEVALICCNPDRRQYE